MLPPDLAAPCSCQAPWSSCQAPWSYSRPVGCPQTTAGLSASLRLASGRASRRTWQKSDITEEDLEEAGVQDPAHKRLLLDTLQLSK